MKLLLHRPPPMGQDPQPNKLYVKTTYNLQQNNKQNSITKKTTTN